MSDTQVKAKSPTQMLRQDHRTVRELFAEYAKLGGSDLSEKVRLFEEIHGALTIHSEIEERLFYPTVRDVRTDDAEDIVNEAIDAHQEVSTLLEELVDLEVGGDPFEAQMKVLRDNVERHIAEEEKSMFPLEAKLPKEVQESLLIEMESLRSDLEDEE